MSLANHPHEDHQINHESGIQPSFATIHHHVQAANWLAAGAANGLFRNNSSASSNIPLSCDALCGAPSQVTRQDPWRCHCLPCFSLAFFVQVEPLKDSVNSHMVRVHATVSQPPLGIEPHWEHHGSHGARPKVGANGIPACWCDG